MQPARIRLAVPNDPAFLDRLDVVLAKQGPPSISIATGQTTMLTFEADTAELMLRARVIQALEQAAGEGWQSLVQPLG